MKRLASFVVAGLVGAMLSAPAAVLAAPVAYRYASVDGIRIFYREAGDRNKPTIVLLHGFPSSSHMLRDLIPLLSMRFQLVAPDYPRMGFSDAPPAD